MQKQMKSLINGNRRAILCQPVCSNMGLGHCHKVQTPKHWFQDLPFEEGSLNSPRLITTRHPTPFTQGRTYQCGQMASSAVGIRGIPGQRARQVIIPNYRVWQEEEKNVWFWQHCWNYKAFIRLLDQPLTSNECPWRGHLISLWDYVWVPTSEKIKIIFQRHFIREALNSNHAAKRIRISADPSIMQCDLHPGALQKRAGRRPLGRQLHRKALMLYDRWWN